MGIALYRKYRSSSIGEILGQDHIVKIVKSMIDKDSIPHAFLLTGPRGVGKTSIARLMAVMVNDIDYSDIDKQLDIIEIDGASNRRIDEIRDLREQVNIVPSSLRYKVYIIDEVHMLTKESFNALLKTLEEPPSYVIFILATTELNKLPATIISRCLRFNFKAIDDAQIKKHIADICQKEKIKIDDAAINLLAKHSGGSFRDAISILENFRYFDEMITVNHIQEYLGLPSEEIVSGIIHAVSTSNIEAVRKYIDEVRNLGINCATLANDISHAIRTQILMNTLPFKKAYGIALLDDLLDVQSSKFPDQKLLIAILKTFEPTDINTGEKQHDETINSMQKSDKILQKKKYRK